MNRLELVAHTHDHYSVVPSELPMTSISAMAEQLAQRLGIDDGGELVGPIQAMGGRIHFLRVGEAMITHSLAVRGANSFDIWLWDHASDAVNRFCIAHELGHFILHYLRPLQSGATVQTPLFAPRYSDDKAEREADHFAESLLMPQSRFISVFETAQGNIDDVSDYFNVPARHSIGRAQALGLIDPA